MATPMEESERRRMRDLMAHFATGVTVVAARHGPLLAGMTANAIATISIDPPILMASIARKAETGSPILEGALAYFDCRLIEHHDGGDHTIFLGEIVAAGFREDAQPLLWYGSGYRRLAP